MSENAIKISIALELVFSTALADLHIQGSRKCAGFSLVAGSEGDFHPSGFSSLWIFIPLDSTCFSHGVWTPLMKKPGLVQSIWAHPWGLGTFLGSAHAPSPGFFPACRGTFKALHLALLLGVFPDSVTSSISMMAHRGCSQNPSQSVA